MNKFSTLFIWDNKYQLMPNSGLRTLPSTVFVMKLRNNIRYFADVRSFTHGFIAWLSNSSANCFSIALFLGFADIFY